MRKIRDVLRLTAAGMSSRNIALSLSIGATTVIDFLQRARLADMSWPPPEDMTDEALEARLFPASTALAEIKARRPQPDWRTIHCELRRKGVTLQLLWEEHRAAHPNGYGYPDQSCAAICGFSCSSIFNKDLLTLMSPLYSIKPSFRNLFMKKLTWVRLVPIISASVS